MLFTLIPSFQVIFVLFIFCYILFTIFRIYSTMSIIFMRKWVEFRRHFNNSIFNRKDRLFHRDWFDMDDECSHLKLPFQFLFVGLAYRIA